MKRAPSQKSANAIVRARLGIALLAAGSLGCQSDEITRPKAMSEVMSSSSVSHGASPRAGLSPVDISEGIESIAYDVNDAGLVVGDAGAAVRFSPITPLLSPSGVPQGAFGVSTQGYVAGSGFGPAQNTEAFVTNPGSVVWLASLPGSQVTKALDVNDLGHVVGYSLSSNTSQAVFWSDALFALNYGTPGVYSMANGINNADVVVGASEVGGIRYPTKWMTPGVPVLLPLPPGMIWGSAGGITTSGYIVGVTYPTPSAGGSHAALWNSAGAVTDLHAACESAVGAAVNDSEAKRAAETAHGEVLISGICGDHAAVWFRLLDGTIAIQLLSPLPEHSQAQAFAVNAQGDVVGTSLSDTTIRATQWGVTVPDLPPVVSLTVPNAASEGTAAQLNGTAQDPNDPNTPITFDWDFGDGSPHANGCCPSHTWVDNGSYTVTVTASDGTQSASASGTVVVANVAPTATFGAPSTDVTASTTFQLDLTNPQDVGSADVTAGFFYSFDCGGGTLAPALGPTVSCTAPSSAGQITVRGRILDKDSDGTTYTATVNVVPVPNLPPVVQPVAPMAGNEGSPIQFTAVATDPEGQPLTYDWDFGDGTPHSTGATPSHTYEDNGPGSYAVSLVVSDGALTTTVTSSVNVANVAPTANLVAPGSVTAGFPFAVALNSLMDVSPVDLAAGFQFQFDCGSGTLQPAAGSSTMCTAPGVPGSITVRGEIIDKDGGNTVYSASVSIAVNAPPSLSLTGPYSGAEGSALAMQAFATDPESQPLTYDWDFGDGSPHGAVAAPSHAYPDNGSYTITVRVSDGVNTTTATTSASVSNAQPSGTPVAPTAPVNQGTPFSISIAGATDPSPVDRTSLQFRFSCGGAFSPFQTSPTFSCTQASPGTYTVQMRIRDKDGGVVTYSSTVTVANVAPTVSISGPATVHIPVGGTLNLSGTFTDPGTADNPWQARITWGAGQGLKNLASVSPGIPITGSHVYATAGTYSVKLYVQDKFGAIGQRTLSVIVP